MDDFSEGVRLPAGNDGIAAVTILDHKGQVVRVISAAEFRRSYPRKAVARFGDSARRRPRVDRRASKASPSVAAASSPSISPPPAH